jgi:DNA (cytosine-5)-methyltransferase 1
MNSLRFVDLFAGLGGFHVALSSLGHECVYASEIDAELRELYLKNFPDMQGKVHGDVRETKHLVPDHDFLCAGFPCQPFSKSGGQLGLMDQTRGTLFHEILDILTAKRPKYVLLENVGNFGRHDEGRTWSIVKQRLSDLGYDVIGTEHVTPKRQSDWRDAGQPSQPGTVFQLHPAEKLERKKGPGLISPHHFGFPHHRERFYIFAVQGNFTSNPFPVSRTGQSATLNDIVQRQDELSESDILETRLTNQQLQCIEHWNALIQALPLEIEPPSFPLWGDELGATYPYQDRTPWASAPMQLGQSFDPPLPKYTRRKDMLCLLPSYAREEIPKFRHWKIRFIQQNRDWWNCVTPLIQRDWEKNLKKFPPSLRKLEWNAKGEERNIWKYVLQFRPSGLRVKRYSSSPALVAMTATQIPVLGPERRFITRVEGKRLQGFPDSHYLPNSRERAFKALGNAVHVQVVKLLAQSLLQSKISTVKIEAVEVIQAELWNNNELVGVQYK